jgi:hypothetical protein
MCSSLVSLASKTSKQTSSVISKSTHEHNERERVNDGKGIPLRRETCQQMFRLFTSESIEYIAPCIGIIRREKTVGREYRQEFENDLNGIENSFKERKILLSTLSLRNVHSFQNKRHSIWSPVLFLGDQKEKRELLLGNAVGITDSQRRTVTVKNL